VRFKSIVEYLKSDNQTLPPQPDNSTAPDNSTVPDNSTAPPPMPSNASCSDASCGYDPETDTKGRVWHFRPWRFHFSMLPDTMEEDSNNTVKHFQGVSTDGVFKLIGHISGGAFNSSAGMVAPISFKFDIVIDGSKFRWKLNDSKLALIASVMSDVESGSLLLNETGHDLSELGGQTAHTILIGEHVKPIGFFQWVRNVTLSDENGGNSTANIIVSPLSRHSEYEDMNEDGSYGPLGQFSADLAFSVDAVQPQLIEWDPVIGVGKSSKVPAPNGR